MEAIQAIDRELERLHNELSSFTDPSDCEYEEVFNEIKRVNSFLMEVARAHLTIAKERSS
jgi:hypothetical protein